MFTFIFTFLFGLLPLNQSAQSMESHDDTKPSFEKTPFTLSIEDNHFEFRPFDLLNISDEYRTYFTQACGDFEAVQQMFNFWIAAAFGTLSVFDSDVGYKAMVNLLKKEKKDPSFIRFDWFIFDINKNEFAGILSLQNKLKFQLSSSTEKKLNLSANQIWEIEGGLMKSYRNKKIATNLMPLFINTLKSFPLLQNAWILFAANIDDAPVHRLACGTTYLGRQNALIDFSEFTYSLKVDVFGFKLGD